MRTIALAAAVLLSATASAQPAEAPPDTESLFPPPVHQTVLEATYDPETRGIDGHQRLRWRNSSSVPIEELHFHLYLNAFSSNRSTFMVESGGQMRGAEFGDDENWGWIQVDSITLADGTDLKPGERFPTPDDDNPWDRTVAAYPLPRPLLPGEWVVVEIDFTAQLPSPPFARTGAHENGDYVLAGQWYPHVAVFEDAGVRHREEPGWNAHQFHAASEFYADFGDYDVTLTLPERYRGKIGATGRKVADSVANGQVTVRYRQRGVHDFAWTGDPNFVVLRDTFDPQEDVPADYTERFVELLGVPASELALTPVAIELYLQPAHRFAADRYMEAAKAGIRGYGIRYGAYPYGTLTMVDGPPGALGSMGMEYPTFITLGAHKLLDMPFFGGILASESVTVHEFGHQYFQGMVASNEFEESWLDEGVNTYAEGLVMEESFGPSSIDFMGTEIRHLESHRSGGLDNGEFRDAMVTPSWRFVSRGSYGLNSYPRVGMVLTHLERLLGEQTFARAMRDYFQQWRFRHPDSRDFQEAIERSTGQDLDWFFRQAFRSSRNLDYAVRDLSVERVGDRRGTFWAPDGSQVEMPEDSESGEGEGEETEEARGEGPWKSEVLVFRHGEFIHPITLELTFADGSVERREWDGEKRWARWTFLGGPRLVSAEVDPDDVMVLDLNRLNNGRTREEDSGPALGYMARILFWVQTLMAATGLLA